MKFLRQVGACFLAASISQPVVYADEFPFGDTAAVRRYLVHNDFFDRLDSYPVGMDQSIEAQIKTGYRQVGKLYQATIQE